MSLSDPTANMMPRLRGRHLPWLFFAAAVAVLVATGITGANHYDSMPETIATHWGANGEPDEFAPKSVGTVFMQLFIGTGTVAFLMLLSWIIGRSMRPRPGDSTFKKLQRISLARSTSLVLGLSALGMAGVLSYAAQAGWQPGATFSAWPIVIGSALLLPAILVAYWLGERWRARRAHELGITPDGEEQQESSRWVAGFLYNDPADPALFVPKREGTGHGTTLNIGNSKGKLISLLFLLFVIAFPLVTMLVSA